MKSEIKNLLAMALAGALVALVLVSLFSVRGQRIDVENLDEIARLENQLRTSIERGRRAEAAVSAARDRERELEAVATAERETTLRLAESDKRSREGIERIAGIIREGTDIIDELIRFFEDYED